MNANAARYRPPIPLHASPNSGASSRPESSDEPRRIPCARDAAIPEGAAHDSRLLQVVIVLIGMGALAVMLWAPHLEGRNVHASLFQVYFNDPLLACAYIASVPFFVALYQAFILLGHIGRNKVFLPDSVRALRIIKYCAMSLVALLLAAVIYFLIVVRGQDDIAGGVAISIFLIFVSTVVAAAASVLETTLQNTFDRSEGDLTA